MESKNIYKAIEADMAQFKALGDKWVAEEDKSSCAKSRSYAKKLMKSLKMYVSTSIADEKLVKPKPVVVEEVVAEVIEEEVEVEEVAEEIEEEVVEEEESEDAPVTSYWYSKK